MSANSKPMAQMLLFPDPRPLVDRLGAEFFRNAPQSPGVYLMRDRAEVVLYVGKAKNLRKRLGSYRVANPDRLPRRHLRLLRAVERIELQTCADEAAAIARESNLIRTLRPRFNRAGTWPGKLRFLVWRVTEKGLDLAVTETAQEDWKSYGPLGSNALFLRTALARLAWCALNPGPGLAGLPEGWLNGRCRTVSTIPRSGVAPSDFESAVARLTNFFAGEVDEFIEWVLASTAAWQHPFELAVREAEVTALLEWAAHQRRLE